MTEGVMNGRFKKVTLHDALHGFREKRWCGAGITDAKFLQQLAFIEQCSLYGTFLDLRKAYDAMDRSRCLRILEEAGAGHKTLHLIQHFWDKAIFVCKASGCFSDPLQAWRGVTQGRSVSPNLQHHG